MANKHIGSSFESLLKEDGFYENAENTAVKRVLTWQIQQAMKDQHINKQRMAVLMKTSRAQVDRLLNPENSKVQLDTIQRAAAALGRRLVISIEPSQ